MADGSSTCVLLQDPLVAALDETEGISRSAFSCSDLNRLAGDEGTAVSEDEMGEVTRSADEPLPSDGSNMMLVFMTIVFAGVLAACGVLIVKMMRADEAAFVRRLEQRMPQVEPKHIQVEVDLAQLYTGYHAQVDVDRKFVCTKCVGTGEDASAGFHTCHKCQGTGVTTSVEQIGPFQQQIRSVCKVCQGRGRVANSKCGVCKGKGLRRESTTLDVYIEKGVHHGDNLVLPRKGDQAVHHLSGNIIVHVIMTPHPLFTRREDDLELALDITLLEECNAFTALVGFTREILHLDGRVVALKREEVVQPTTVWRIPNEGMPRRSQTEEFGSLLVYFNILYPTELSSDAKAVVGQLLSA